MASTRKTDWPLGGLLLPDQRFAAALLSSSDSSYTQAGPCAGGVATPEDGYAPAVLETLGDQDTELQFVISSGGYPGPTNDLRVLYNQTADGTNNTLKGHNSPNLIQNWFPVSAFTGVLQDAIDAVALPNGKILVLGVDTGTAATFYTIDCNDHSVASDTITGGLGDIGDRFCSLCVGPNREVYALVYDGSRAVVLRYSVDTTNFSADFQYHSIRPFGASEPTTDVVKGCLLYSPGADEYAYFHSSGGIVTQFASNDKLATLTQIGSINYGGSFGADAVALLGGGFGLVYRVNVSGDIMFVRVGSAYDVAETAAAVTVVSADNYDEAWLYQDPAGPLYCYGRRSGSTQDRIDVFYSTDSGSTWTDLDNSVYWTPAGDTNTYTTNHRAVDCLGAPWIIHQKVDGGGASGDGSVFAMRCGGWSNVTVKSLYSGISNMHDERFRASFGDGAEWTAASYLPLALPDNHGGWTATGAGTATLDTGATKIVTSANAKYYETSTVAAQNVMVLCEFKVESGGATNSPQAGFSVSLDDGVNYQELLICASTTAFAVRDSLAGTTLDTTTTSMTDYVQILLFWRLNAEIDVYYKSPSAEEWTQAYYSTSALTTAAGTTTALKFGGQVNSTTTAWYRMFLSARSNSQSEAWWGYNGGEYFNLVGRRVTASASALRTVATTGDRVTYLRATDGPGRLGDTYTVAPAYDYPATNIDCLASPSPRAKWRSTSTAEQIFAWTPDSTYDTGLGGRSMGIALLGINFESAVLEGWDGAAWVALITYSGKYKLAGLKYTRTGNMIRIDSGGTAASRTILRNELVGARVNLGSSKIRVIAKHTEGLWADTAGKHAELRLEGIDGTEPASGTLDIWPHSGYAVAHGISALYDKYRVRIPTATTAEGYFEAGNIIVGEVLAFGTPISWGSNYKYDPNAESFEDRSGTSRRRALGPVKPSWTIAWTDESDLSNLRNLTPDYFAHTSTTEGMANFGDAPWQLAGLVEELKSGEVPVVFLANIPLTSSEEVTDPSLFLYGRIVSSVQIENVQGDEGEDEVHRVQSITIEGLV